MIVAIVQARVGSSRLRGKVLETIGGCSALAHVLRRAGAIERVERVCCAVPDTPENDPVASEAARAGALIFRGSETDVLARYAGAATACDASVVLRITSDCPLLDPATSSRVVRQYLKGGFDYCSNVEPRSWPKGLDTEVFSRGVLDLANERAADAYDREHVTPWIRGNHDLRRGNVELGENLAEWRWTLDVPEDLAFFRAVAAEYPGDFDDITFEEMRSLVSRRPDIAAINASVA
jgi:spore coat polysaccharide biosynthesis protein SpsF